jgi:hypothetical protein
MCLFSMVHRLVCLFRGESRESTESLGAYHQVPFAELAVEDEKAILSETLPQYEPRN